MNYEEKYKQAFERAKERYSACSAPALLEYIFPELKESEDEMIRKSLIKFFQHFPYDSIENAGTNVNEAIAWLEKQGKQEPYGQRKECEDCQFNYAGECKGLCKMKRDEQKPADEDEPKFRPGDIVQYITDSTDRRKIEEIDTLCNMYHTDSSPIMFEIEDEWKVVVNAEDVEQESANNDEPKFKVGDWVVYDHRPYQVVELPKEGYINLGLRRNGKVEFAPSPYCRHWSIQDAKDGDVLVDVYGNIGIFDKCYDFDWMSCCSLVNNGGFQYFTVKHKNEKTHPATKEQCDTLMKAMANAGYEWDVEKKELKKIGTKFNVDDWIVTDDSFGKIVRHIDAISFNLIDKGYVVSDENGLIYNNISFDCEHKWHKWTIEDAEDGDVVVDKSDETIGIFQSIGHHHDGGSYNDPSYCFLHCRYDDGFFYADFEHGNTIVSDDLIPATKEQRDLLFAKMKEAGYEWDGEKKELKKIKPKTLDSDKVIEWLRQHSCAACWDNSDEGVSQRIEQFKKDFEL